MEALGVYIRTLREGRRMPRTGTADFVGVDATTLWRVEEGKQEPGGSLILNLLSVLRGDYEDARRLLGDKNATGDDARVLAQQRLGSHSIPAAAAEFANGFTADELDAIRQQLASDPAWLDTILDATAREILRRQRR